MSTRYGGVAAAAIVNVSARVHAWAPGQYVDYAASKGAIDTFTVGLAREVAAGGHPRQCRASRHHRHRHPCFRAASRTGQQMARRCLCSVQALPRKWRRPLCGCWDQSSYTTGTCWTWQAAASGRQSTQHTRTYGLQTTRHPAGHRQPAGYRAVFHPLHAGLHAGAAARTIWISSFSAFVVIAACALLGCRFWSFSASRWPAFRWAAACCC
jgi:hypothetical protein